jgi:hypothetical protein
MPRYLKAEYTSRTRCPIFNSFISVSPKSEQDGLIESPKVVFPLGSNPLNVDLLGVRIIVSKAVFESVWKFFQERSNNGWDWIAKYDLCGRFSSIDCPKTYGVFTPRFDHYKRPLGGNIGVSTISGSVGCNLRSIGRYQPEIGLLFDEVQSDQPTNTCQESGDSPNPDRQNVWLERLAPIALFVLCVAWFNFCLWLADAGNFRSQLDDCAGGIGCLADCPLRTRAKIKARERSMAMRHSYIVLERSI